VSIEPAATRLLRALATVLQRFGDRWYLFGAQAVVAWGRPRLTADVDVTVFLEPEEPEGFAIAMKQAGFELRVRDVAGFVRRTRVLPFLHLETNLPLDIVLGGPGLEEEFLHRARRIDVGGTAVRVIAPEDLVASKVLAGRAKDLEDVRTILLAQRKTLDIDGVRSLLGAIETAIDRRDLLPLFEAQLGALKLERR